MEEHENHSLETARGYIKLAKSYADYKRIEGYNDDNYNMFEVVNLDASLEICKRGPADYYYEKAYDLLCSQLGKDHPETRQLVKEIIRYHVDNVQRMMQENYVMVMAIMYFYLTFNIPVIVQDRHQWTFVFACCNAAFALYWFLEQQLMCLIEKHHYRRMYSSV